MKYQGEALCFDDVLLTPGLTDVRSRKDVDLTMSHKNISLSLPIFSAPMDSITGFDMVLTMREAGGMAVLPRSGINQSQVFIQLITALDFHDFFYSVSSGVTSADFEEIEWLRDRHHKFICVEVAHGGNAQTINKVKVLRDMYPEVTIMSGNVATYDEFKSLSDAGADFIRVGIGGGSACTTRIQTGHGVPTLQSILDVFEKRNKTDAAIIADGGIRSSGDAAKAFAAGAQFVMLGGSLAGTSSCNTIRDSNGEMQFRGMASAEHTTSVEGTSFSITEQGETMAVLGSFEKGLQSACSYGGVYALEQLCDEAEYRKVTPNCIKENGAHYND